MAAKRSKRKSRTKGKSAEFVSDFHGAAFDDDEPPLSKPPEGKLVEKAPHTLDGAKVAKMARKVDDLEAESQHQPPRARVWTKGITVGLALAALLFLVVWSLLR